MDNKKWYEGAYMLNRDPDWLLFQIDDSSKEAMASGLDKLFDEYSKHSVTDVLLEVFTQGSYIPSNVAEWIAEEWRRVRDTKPDFDNRWKPYYTCYVEYGLDPVQMFIDRVTANGKRAWISLRMNDCHWDNDENGNMVNLVNSDFWREARDTGNLVGEEYGYYKICYNFAYEKYRNLLLDYIDEILGKYDFFGIELNFLREMYCLDYRNDPECHKIMTQFLRDVKARVEKAEKRVGHKIQILIRLARDIKSCVGYGFDVRTIVDEGLVDVISPCARWRQIDSCIPVREWMDFVGDKVGILPGLELVNAGRTWNTLEDTKGFIAGFLGQGAPGTYLYNYFWYNDDNRNVWMLTPEACLSGKRRFSVTEQDIAPYTEERFKPFPIVLENSSATLHVDIGPLKASDSAKLTVNFEGDEPPTLTVGGKTIVGEITERDIRIGCDGKDVDLTCFTPVGFDLSGIETESHLDLTFSGKGKIYFAQITINAK